MTVVHITGLWRSGSTILDIILGGHDSVEGVGELRHLALGWIDGLTCACGEPVRDCPFWAEVHARWRRRVGGDKTERLIMLQDQFERTRALPTLLAGGVVRRSAAFKEYGELAGALYAAVSEVGGRRIIVDSSKYPGRALALARMPHVDFRIVHLVRDGRAVIWSCRRKPNTDLQGNVYDFDADSVARTTTNAWIRANLYAGFARSMAREPSIRVRYEDFVSSPRRELGRIGDLMGIDFAAIADRLASGGDLRVGHPVAGNRVRHSGSVRLRPDLEWREKLAEPDRKQFWKRAGWLARRYGYVRSGTPGSGRTVS